MTLGCKYSNNGSIPGRRTGRRKKKENRKQVSNKKKTRRKKREKRRGERKRKKKEMEKENRRKGDKFKAFYFPPRWRHSVFLCLAATNRRVNQIVYTLLSDYCF